MKKNKGITLVVLILTIAVTIILAGVSIELIMGDDKAVSKAKGAKSENVRIQFLDRIKAETEASIDEFGDYDQKKALYNIIKNDKENNIEEIIVEVNGRLGITFNNDDYKFKCVVSNRGEVISVFDYVYEEEDEDYLLKSMVNGADNNAYRLLVPIPFGFNVSSNEDEKKIEKGLVISNSNSEDKYVWIPVNEEYLNSILVSNKDGDLYYYETIKLEDDEKCKIIEPYFVSEEKVKINEDEEIKAEEFNMILKRYFNNSIKSIKGYGGFYISKEKLNIGQKTWIEYWNKQKEVSDKYSSKQKNKLQTDMIFGFQARLVGKFLEQAGEYNNLGYSKNSVVITQSAVVDPKEENKEFKYANLKFDFNYENVEDISDIKRDKNLLVNGFFTTICFE